MHLHRIVVGGPDPAAISYARTCRKLVELHALAQVRPLFPTRGESDRLLESLPEREASEPFLTSLFCWARDPQARRGGENAADIQLLDSMYRQSVVKLLGTRDPCYRFRCPAQRSAHRETPTEKRLTHMRDLNRRQGATFAESKHKPRRRNTKPSKKASPLSVSL